MQSARWGAMTEVGDQSAYVNTIKAVLADWGQTLGTNLVKIYANQEEPDYTNLVFWCDKVVRMFIPRWVKCASKFLRARKILKEV